MSRLGVMSAVAALAFAGAMSPSVPMYDEVGPGEATIRTRHKPSGSKPVSGGGARERARRMARMDKLEAEANGGEGTDPFDTSEVE